MNYRVYFGFYVDVQDVESERTAREAAEAFLHSDLIDRFDRPGQTPAMVLTQAHMRILERARAWFQRAELRR